MYKILVSKGINYKNWNKEKTVILAVSIYNKNFYDKKFSSIFNWAQNNFEKIELIICDSLHRYNIMYQNNINEIDARILSKKLKNEWINSNYHTLCGLKNLRITDWDFWCNEKFMVNKKISHLENLYITDQIFAINIDSYLDYIFLRFKKDIILPLEIINYKKNILKPYFFEETAVTSIFLKEIDGLIAYPGSLPKIWGNFINTKYDHLDGFYSKIIIKLDVKKYKHIK